MTTTTNPPAARPTPAWLKGSLLAALVFGACWVAAIWYWDATRRSPTTSDLVLYLLALPLALFMASGFARSRLATPAAAPTAAAAAPVDSALAHPVLPPLAILAASLRSPHGDSPEELSEAILNNTARADLDGEFVGADGFPVMSARSGSASDDALHEEIMDWWSANGISPPAFSDEQWRALTMASAVAGELASRAARDLIPAEGVPPMLQLRPILPSEWHIDARRGVGMWLKHTVTQFGWPQAYVALADDKQGIGTTPSMLARLAQESENGSPLVAIVLACASNISAETVDQWAANGSLFSSTQPQGLVPGEGSAGLLLTDLRLARSLEDPVFTLLDPVAEARRDVSADDARRTDAVLLSELAGRVLRGGAVQASEVAAIVADTGLRARRTLELMGFAAAAMPQLDGTGDIVCVGAASGSCGAVPFMTALALAHHNALARNAPVLCIGNEDPYLRCTALIRPAESSGNQGHASA